MNHSDYDKMRNGTLFKTMIHRLSKQWTHRSDIEVQEHRNQKSKEDSAFVNDASDVHGALTVRADKATFAKTSATKALNVFFKSNDKYKELSAIAKALKA